MQTNNSTPILAMKGISKGFPGVQALQGVSFDLYRGELHAILGENGAGKSTLIKILGGIYTADEGSIEIDGKPAVIKGVGDAKAYGISVIHQELCLATNMTVAENIFLGREAKKRVSKMVDDQQMEREADAILEELAISSIRGADRVSDLSISQQQMVEIAKALSINASIVVMDEPTSSLTESEVRGLFEFIRKCKDRGLAFIYISHRMNEIYEMSDRITVLRDGAYIETVETKGADPDYLIKLMVGRDVKDMYHPVDLLPTKEKLLEVKNLSSAEVENISFDLYKGEILGVFGLMGAGRTELSRALFGVDRQRGGEVAISGQKMPASYGPRLAVDRGLALIPESRKEQGLVLIETVRFNMLLPVFGKVFRALRINHAYADETVDEYSKKLSIKTGGPDVLCSTLSGGNQQKIVLSKWLATHPRVLILDEPTRGIDVGAKSEIYAIMQQLAQQGIGIIMISSELPEIVNLSTRVMVMHEGAVTAFLEKPDINQETIMRYAVGG